MPQWFGGDCLVDFAPKAFSLQQWPEMKKTRVLLL